MLVLQSVTGDALAIAGPSAVNALVTQLSFPL
jgi:hypothetical protein